MLSKADSWLSDTRSGLGLQGLEVDTAVGFINFFFSFLVSEATCNPNLIYFLLTQLQFCTHRMRSHSLARQTPT